MDVPRFPKHLLDAAQLYCDIMQEIKGRIDVLYVAGKTGFQPHAVPAHIIGDLFYIEFRMICELVAIGCLVAHGDVSGARTQKLLSEWKAGVIMNQLEKLHPEFYPVPEEISRNEKGKWVGGKVMVQGFITKPQLLELHSECGKNLHRGSALEIRAQMNAGAIPLPDIDRFKSHLDGLVNLLRHHTIDLIDPTRKFWVSLESSETKGVAVKVVDVSALGGMSRSELLAKYRLSASEKASHPDEPR